MGAATKGSVRPSAARVLWRELKQRLHARRAGKHERTVGVSVCGTMFMLALSVPGKEVVKRRGRDLGCLEVSVCKGRLRFFCKPFCGRQEKGARMDRRSWFTVFSFGLFLLSAALAYVAYAAQPGCTVESGCPDAGYHCAQHGTACTEVNSNGTRYYKCEPNHCTCENNDWHYCGTTATYDPDTCNSGTGRCEERDPDNMTGFDTVDKETCGEQYEG